MPSTERPIRRQPPAHRYIGSSSSSLSVSLSRSSVPHIGRLGAGLIGEGAIGGMPGVSVPSVVCSVAREGEAARRLRVAAGREEARFLEEARFVDEARFVRPPVRRAVRARVDVRRLELPPRLRRLAALPLRERVLARFFRRVLLAIVGLPLILMGR